MIIHIGVPIVGLATILGSAIGVAQPAAGTSLAAPGLTLSASSVSASRTIVANAVALRANATYELISSTTRTDPSSTEVLDALTVLARVKTDSRGQFSTRFVVPLNWRHDHLIEVQKVEGADLVEQAPDWLTVTPPRPALALGIDKVYAGSQARVVVSGLRARTKYEVFSSQTRSFAGCNCGGGTSSDGPALRSFRTDANGRALFKLTVPDRWRFDYLIEVRKAKGGNPARGANAWLTVVR